MQPLVYSFSLMMSTLRQTQILQKLKILKLNKYSIRSHKRSRNIASINTSNSTSNTNITIYLYRYLFARLNLTTNQQIYNQMIQQNNNRFYTSFSLNINQSPQQTPYQYSH